MSGAWLSSGEWFPIYPVCLALSEGSSSKQMNSRDYFGLPTMKERLRSEWPSPSVGRAVIASYLAVQQAS